MEKKRLLVVIQLLRRGGVELAALNFALNLDRNKYDITFFLQNPYANQDDDLVDEVKSQGVKIIERPENVKGYFKNYKYIKKLFLRASMILFTHM